LYKHILIPTDGSQLATKAVEHGLAFAKEIGAKVTVVMAWEPFHVFTFNRVSVEDTPELYRQHMQQLVGRTLGVAANAAKAAGVPCETVQVEEEHPYKAIINTAQSKGCDLIVMASHGRRGISAVLIGSETVKVLTHSKIPVLVHR